ncbi:hypothetical protein [Pseudovibrio sp. FO-BEG1]|uniref:hypothetical protein n=1 Tax=Pseudovibrio sp. (strain FO-BEG1) TaxID=911045 RepID=UPI00031B68BA|nr:hypothetical protein [Pseudovibrio sp. FO-BEG1]
MMRRDYREFYLYDLHVSTTKRNAQLPNMMQIASVFQELKDAGWSMDAQNGDKSLLIGDVSVDADRSILTLLVRVSDKTAPDSVYSNHAEQDFTLLEKNEGQGNDYGAHVLISLEPNADVSNVYLSAIEKVIGVPATYVQRLLSKALHHQYSDQSKQFFAYENQLGQRDQQGELKIEKCCPRIELRGCPSDTFEEDIARGRIHDITLIQERPVTPMGGLAYMHEKSLELKIGIDYGSIGENIAASIGQGLRSKSSEYSRAKIRLKLPDTDKTTTVDVTTNDFSPISSLYIKFFSVSDIFPLLAHSSANIVEHLKEAAIGQFIAMRNFNA